MGNNYNDNTETDSMCQEKKEEEDLLVFTEHFETGTTRTVFNLPDNLHG